MEWKGFPHVLSANQFDHPWLEWFFRETLEIKRMLGDPVESERLAKRYTRRTLWRVFYQPSTRTWASFGFAAGNLGMKVDGTEHAGIFSSAAKGERLRHTIETLATLGASVIVLRHPERGAAAHAATFSTVPIINAGDGDGEHPTQALLDILRIREVHGRVDNLRLVIGGDLTSRTSRSLALLLSKFHGVHIFFISPEELSTRDDIRSQLRSAGTTFEELTSLKKDVLASVHGVYWTRPQWNFKGPFRRIKSVFLRRKIMEEFTLRLLHVGWMPPDAKIWHPMPITYEIAPEVFDDPHADWLQQARGGVFARTTLLDTQLRPLVLTVPMMA